MGPRGKRWAATALAAVGLFVVGGLGGTAQDVTPTGSGPAHAHPAHVHRGNCAELDPSPAFPLADVAPAPNGPGVGADEAAAISVERSATTLDVPLDELGSGGYAINVHRSAEDIGTYIACGNLGDIDNGSGTDQGGTLIVGLRELNGSGHSGLAILEGRGGRTEATIYLAEGLSGAGAAAAGTATADGEAEATANEVVVDIKDFTYTPDPIEIPAGGTVVWTNRDAAPHTATARDRGVLQSGTLDQGERFSQTFEEPGTFDYFCEFHAGMKGTIVVQ